MRDRLLRDGFVILAVVFVGLRLFAVKPWADSVDAYAYWTTRDGIFYDAATTGRIVQANAGQIGPGGFIHPGQKLRIPPV